MPEISSVCALRFIGDVSRNALEKIDLRLFQDNVHGFHVRHIKAFLRHIGYDFEGNRRDDGVCGLSRYACVLERFYNILAADPLVDELILFEDVNINARMFAWMRLSLSVERPLCQSFAWFRAHIDGERSTVL